MQFSRLFPLAFVITWCAAFHCEGQSIELIPVDLTAGNATDSRTDSPMRIAASRTKTDPNDLSLSKWFRAGTNGNSGFFLFYNNIRVRETKSEFVVQTVTRTVETLEANGTRKAEVQKLVEAFKLRSGSLKSPDQHFGLFSLGQFEKKTMVKEAEIGIVKSIDGKEYPPTAWPWDAAVLHTTLHSYDDPAESAPQVTFAVSKKWKFSFDVHKDGELDLQAPDLGIEFRVRNPVEPAKEKNNAVTTEEAPQLIAGSGVEGLITIHKTTLEEVVKALGEPVERVNMKTGTAIVLFSNGLAVHVNRNSQITTVTTGEHNRASVRIGDAIISNSDGISTIIEKLGEPKNKVPQVISYDGLSIWRVNDRVVKFVVH